VIVAPTEPQKLRAAAQRVSMLPERFGCDVIWRSRGRWVGVQRKEVADLCASVGDGRLGQQLSQMKDLLGDGGTCVVMVEGEPRWTLDGEMVTGGWGRGLTRQQWAGVLWTVQANGAWLWFTRDLDGTIEALTWLKAWTAKDRHTSLVKREKPVAPWGNPGNADFARHVLMGLPGVGVETATRVVERFGGGVVGWTVTREELETVDGIGKKKADAMWRALGGDGGG